MQQNVDPTSEYCDDVLRQMSFPFYSQGLIIINFDWGGTGTRREHTHTRAYSHGIFEKEANNNFRGSILKTSLKK